MIAPWLGSYLGKMFWKVVSIIPGVSASIRDKNGISSGQMVTNRPIL
jgi:hypothetical protein